MPEGPPERWRRISALVEEASRLSSVERHAFIDTACADDPVLKSQVKKVLACTDLAGAPGAEAGTPGSPERAAGPGAASAPDTGELTTATPASTASPPDSIGPYRLIQQIGEGGMGQVWLAEQTRPVQRKVALKLIKAGMDTKQVIARFEAERQALALMDHPAIAKVYEAGETPGHLPYFAMEYVAGEPITRYCDRHALSVPERLNLFMRVCEGVQHAHQKGLIHRDLKPSNVLVTVADEKPVPKIIDFGVAKATAQRLTERTMVTELGMFIGTPEYISPEQAEMTGLDVDTRTDVYALGVILYELLTGALPFELTEARQAGYDEIRRRIREVEPPRPSTRVSRLDERSAEMAKRRRSEPPRLAARLKGDLDWIVMKALEKDRTRRYGSAADLAADVQRHLTHQPVLAGPPSAIYRAGKFVRRHRFGVAVAALALVALVGFAVTTKIQSARTARERDRANREAEVARRVSEFVIGLFNVSDPREARGNTITAREILDTGANRISGELNEQPDVKATLLLTMSRVYESLGLYDRAHTLAQEAVDLRRRALGDDHPDVARSVLALARIQTDLGDYAGAETLLNQALAVERKTLGNENADVADTLQGLGTAAYIRGDFAGAEKLYRESLSIRRHLFGDAHPDIAKSLCGVGNALRSKGDLAGAEAAYREAIALQRRLLGPDHPDLTRTVTNLGAVLFDRGDFTGAEASYREALAIARKVYGSEHPQVATVMTQLANALDKEHHVDEAVALYRQAIAMQRKLLGNEHESVAWSLANLAAILNQQGSFQEAEPLVREALSVQRRVLGSEHPDVANSMVILGNSIEARGDARGAEALYREALALDRKALGNDHGYVADNLKDLGHNLHVQHRLDEAEKAYREALDIRRREPQPNDEEIALCLLGLGTVLTDAGRARESEPLLREALETMRKRRPPSAVEIANAQSGLAACLTGEHRYDEAESLLLDCYPVLKSGDSPQDTEDARERLVALYDAWGKPGKAVAYRAR